ncbi:hypothetical protein M885DRAFT_508790 [Pelagophyceae sp. CCMP2097]|nr:hypothetical protein M885DRAFT_508790 [Pelagophyceae sp. CCMP2097]
MSVVPPAAAMAPAAAAGPAAHWLNLSNAAHFDEERARIAAIDALIVGDGTVHSGVAGAARAGEAAQVGMMASALRNLLELKFRIDPEKRATWARACAEAARETEHFVMAEKLFDTARRLLEIGAGGAAVEAAMALYYKADAMATIDAAQIDGGNEERFAAQERIVSLRRALWSFAAVERRYVPLADAPAVWARLRGDVLLGPKSHDAHAALGLLRVALPTPRGAGVCYAPQMVDEWFAAWQASCVDAGCVETDATWLTLLCRARKQAVSAPALLGDAFARLVCTECFRHSGVTVAGGRMAKPARSWPPRYRFLAWIGGDSPAERALRKLAKLLVFCVSEAQTAEARLLNLERFERLVHALRPSYHPCNAGPSTARLSLLLMEIARELAKGCARRRARAALLASPRAAEPETAARIVALALNYASEQTARDVSALLVPLARAGLYSRHEYMLAGSISALRDLSGVVPRCVAEAVVPRLRAALTDARAVLWAHQAPAALRALAALARPLLLRTRHWTEDAVSDEFLENDEQACRAAFFDGALPCVSTEVRLTGAAVDGAVVDHAPLAHVVAPLMNAALLAVDANDAAKTRAALLCFDAVLRWTPCRDDDDGSAAEAPDAAPPDALGLQLGEWAPQFLHRVFACVEHREASATVPNHFQANGATRFAGAVTQARQAANAELLRCVCNRLFTQLAPQARRRATAQVHAWALAVAPRAASAKDAASLVMVCVAADVFLRQRAAADLADAVQNEACEAFSSSASRLAFALRLYGGVSRALAPGEVAARLPWLTKALDASLPHHDKRVRKAGRKLLRDALRGMFEKRVALVGAARAGAAQGWPDAARGARPVEWVHCGAAEERVVEAGALLLRRYVVEPMDALVSEARFGEDESPRDAPANRALWLRVLRQLEKGVKGACAVLRDTTDAGASSDEALAAAVTRALGLGGDASKASKGARLVLVDKLNAALEAVAADVGLRNDAKVLRAALKAARHLLTLRCSAQIYRARPALAAVRARRRSLGCDVAARSFARLADDGAPEDRGSHDDSERALCHHWLGRLDAAFAEARRLRTDSPAAAQYARLLQHVAALNAHDYSDVRGAALDCVEAAWPFYGWMLKPLLSAAVEELGGRPSDLAKASGLARDSKRSSALMGACALLVHSRTAVRKLASDAQLCQKLLGDACDFSAQLAQIEDAAERDDVAARFDAIVTYYSGRYVQPLPDCSTLVSKGLGTARDAKVHWRQRYVAAFVAQHALWCADPRASALDWHFFAVQARKPDDSPIPRLALTAVMRALHHHRGQTQRAPIAGAAGGGRDVSTVADADAATLQEAAEEAPSESLFGGAVDYLSDVLGMGPAAPAAAVATGLLAFDGGEPLACVGGELRLHVGGLLSALLREHRRERSTAGDACRSASPVVDALCLHARHSESRCLFPKTMISYASRSFKSRHARFARRLCASWEAHANGAAAELTTAALALVETSNASERGAACAAASEAWAGALRNELSSSRAGAARTMLGRPLPDFYFVALKACVRAASPEHSPCWVDALRYAVGGRPASAFATSALLARLKEEWRSCLGAYEDKAFENGWALAAKWLALLPPVLVELAHSRDAVARDAATALAAQLSSCLIAASDHAFAAVRASIGGCLALCHAVVRDVNVLDVVAFAASCCAPTAALAAATATAAGISASPDDASASAAAKQVDDSERALRRRRETAFAWSRSASRDGDTATVAALLQPMLAGVADADEDHRARASGALITAMHSVRAPLRVEGDGLADLVAALCKGAKHEKWRARHAVAVFCGACKAHNAFSMSLSEHAQLLEALRLLVADAHSEVRDAACASLAAVANNATRAELDVLAGRCAADATAALVTGSAGADGPARRLGAVHALAACVIAFPYDVPAHVPPALVLLARHSNATKAGKGREGRDHAAIRESVKATFAEFKRTHAETWDFITHFFTTAEHDAFADVLTTGDYLV